MSLHRRHLWIAAAAAVTVAIAAQAVPYSALISAKQMILPGEARDYSVVNAFTVHRRTLFFGDSIFAVQWADAFPQASIASRAERGDTTEGMRSRIDEALLTKPEVVFLTGGLNDPSSGISASRTRQNYAAMIAAVRKAGALPVVVAPPLPSSDDELRSSIAELNAWLAGYTASHGVAFVDPNPLISTPAGLRPEFRQEDGIHPNGAAYIEVRQAFAPYVR